MTLLSARSMLRIVERTKTCPECGPGARPWQFLQFAGNFSGCVLQERPRTRSFLTLELLFGAVPCVGLERTRTAPRMAPYRRRFGASVSPWSGRMPGSNSAPVVQTAARTRYQGSVLDQAGYDPATGLYLDTGHTSFPKVPHAPTKEDAEAALKVILGILDGFPFATDADRAVAVSMILTAIVRRSLRSAPMFVLTAPKMASGKSLLATCASYIATGRAKACARQPDVMEGDALALIDNVERPLGSDMLCLVLTEPIYRDRLLGASKTLTVPSCTTWVATGNNVTVAGDLSTRALVCRIDPQVERPEEREFEVNLHE